MSRIDGERTALTPEQKPGKAGSLAARRDATRALKAFLHGFLYVSRLGLRAQDLRRRGDGALHLFLAAAGASLLGRCDRLYLLAAALRRDAREGVLSRLRDVSWRRDVRRADAQSRRFARAFEPCDCVVDRRLPVFFAARPHAARLHVYPRRLHGGVDRISERRRAGPDFRRRDGAGRGDPCRHRLRDGLLHGFLSTRGRSASGEPAEGLFRGRRSLGLRRA